MQLRDALDDYKRHSGHDTRFAGERRTVTGRFTGAGGRLVHVGAGGRLRDFGYPLTGQTGLADSRFGLAVDDTVTWLDEAPTEQTYVGDTAAVRTVHELDDATVTRYDLTVDDTHVTHATVETPADASRDPDDYELVVFAAFAPDGRDDRIGQLRYEDAVEVYHADEHDFLASATGFETLRGHLPTTFAEVLDADPAERPRARDGGRYEEERLSGEVLVDVPVVDGSATVASLLTDRSETDRTAARERLDARLDELDSPEAIREAGAGGLPVVPDDAPARDAAVADLRVLSLLSAETGLRIAGPDFDTHYRYSGGYGYTWFRDDAEISTFLLEADERVGAGLDDWHARSARMYAATQRADGSWPHRVWPRNGALAPGWANARIEDGPDVDYQADQTGSVVAYLARARAAGVGADAESGTDLGANPDADPDADLDAALVRALAGLDETLAADGRPVPCQNAWEDMTGRFTHTAATFLEAYAEFARHGERLDADGVAVDSDALDDVDDLAAHAESRAREVYDALDDLWVAERGCYALRTTQGKLDDRLDSATLSLSSAHRSFDALADGGAVDDERLDRLVSHVETVTDGLSHETEAISGLVRYEGDGWRRKGQASEKVWTVSTAWGANACAELAVLLADHDDPRADRFAERARDLLAEVSPGGSLCADTSYLPEQFFDDGTPDSATPLGWPHAIRLATNALLADHDLLDGERVAAGDD